ncbi:MAG: nuclear transport factor 2 family protein [Candidatus Acidiferrales bacterium]|jgi:ketosteroid isomerase-like protein
MRIAPSLLPIALTSLLLSLSFATQPPRANAQTPASTNANSDAATTASPAANLSEIPLQRCDRLPVVIVQVNSADKRFLIDTAATSMLNEKSFTSSHSKELRVQSWNQTTALSARVVSIAELKLGSHILRNVTLPAIDLSALAKACGAPLDGVLGVDLLEQLGVTIDLQRSVARLGIAAPSSSEVSVIAEMQQAMHSCAEAFNNADAVKLASCFDPDFVLSSPSGELRGRDQATNHFQQIYFGLTPRVHFSMTMKDQRAVGNVVWSLYEYTIESANVHTTGRGMMLCRKSENHWYILSMHESPLDSAANRVQ